jgi:hypothetical protein
MVTVDRYDSLDGQVVLVTGATRGIGERIAARLVDEGATVYAGARDVEDVTAAAQRAVELDVTDDGAMQAAVDRIADEAGRLDVLVNNAGVAGPEAPLHENATTEVGHVGREPPRAGRAHEGRATAAAGATRRAGRQRLVGDGRARRGHERDVSPVPNLEGRAQRAHRVPPR